MPDIPVIPEGYEILRTIDSPGSANEYIARHKADDSLVRLKTFSFDQSSSATTRRFLRENLRCDISFMEELSIEGIMHIFDYSDTKGLFWIATQPAELEKISDSLEFFASEKSGLRKTIVHQFLSILQRIHNKKVVHRNLSSDSVFLTPDKEVIIGDFGFAGYFSEQSTSRHNTGYYATTAYLPPEVKGAQTFSSDVSCDIFSAGMIAFEILTATSIPRDNLDQIQSALTLALNEQVAKDVISPTIADAILKAIDPSPSNRWPSVNAFSDALKGSSAYRPSQDFMTMPIGQEPTVPITKPMDPDRTTPIELPPYYESPDVTREIPQFPQTPQAPETTHTPETPKVSGRPSGITPLDPSHEIWNDHYEILEKIGEGGQAVVYKAYDHLTHEEIAIKTIWSRHRGDKAATNRLKQGAMIARSLTHRYIIKTYSVEQRIDTEGTDRYVFICMELVKGQLELGDIIEERKANGEKFTIEETLHVILSLLDALSYAHEHTIHRDIKPGNLMLVPKVEAENPDRSDLTKFNIKLIDFGIAKVLSQKHIDVTGKGFRSAYYGAPELADVKTGVDARADVFSVGVMFYQMLTMNIPRKGSPPVNKVNRSVPSALAAVIDKSINADRDKRFKTAAEFTKEINKAMSKFRWLIQTAKIAVILICIAVTVVVVKMNMPEKDRLQVQESMQILQDRAPDKEIASVIDQTVKYADIKGYDAYDNLRKAAFDKLEIAKNMGNPTFEESYGPWKEQEDLWAKLAPAAENIQSIAKAHIDYTEHSGLKVVDYLMKLQPSSAIVSEIKDNLRQSQEVLGVKPYAPDDLEFAADSYDMVAKVYSNINDLAKGSDTPETAEQINNRLKGVEKLRNDFLPAKENLQAITQLKDSDFQHRSSVCLDEAEKYYKTFELAASEKYFALLNQICGTIVSVQDQIDFARSDIELVSTRLLTLCSEDIDTFDNYPKWQQRLEQVYKKKDVLAKYLIIQKLASGISDDVPVEVYKLTASALEQFEKGNTDSAGDLLVEATQKYRKIIDERIESLKHDCDVLSKIPSIDSERINRSKQALMLLSDDIKNLTWPQARFVEQYNSCSKAVAEEKHKALLNFTEQARNLKKRITESQQKTQQYDSFWKSRLIDNYTTVARQFGTSEVESSIENWIHVDDLNSLSQILNKMNVLDSRLDMMLARKEMLDELSAGISGGIELCDRLKTKGISEAEREKYTKLGSQLEKLKESLVAPINNTCPIDQDEEIFAGQYIQIQTDYFKIRERLPYHRARVIKLIDESKSLEASATAVQKLQTLWSQTLDDVIVTQSKPDFTKLQTYLESVKDEVDKWPTDKFSDQMRQTCDTISNAIDQQNKAVIGIISAIQNKKSVLVTNIGSFEEKVNEIFDDKDIQNLEQIAGDSADQALLDFRQLPAVISDIKQKITNIELSDIVDVSENSLNGFEINNWLIDYDKKKARFNTCLSKLGECDDLPGIFEKADKLLDRRSRMQTDYFHGLRDYTLGRINFTDLTERLNNIEADKLIQGMCTFLEKMGNATVPKLSELNNSMATLNKKNSDFKAAALTTLAEVKKFNKDRRQLVDGISMLNKTMEKFSIPSLENSCRQSVASGVDEIENLTGDTGNLEKLQDHVETLWAFFPSHSDWPQWKPFLAKFHIAVSGSDIRLTSSGSLIPVDEKGTPLTLTDFAGDPVKHFKVKTTDTVNFGFPAYVAHKKDPTVTLAFIPASVTEAPEPLYMSVREISNAQYLRFLQETSAKPTNQMTGWVFIGDQNGKTLIGQMRGEFPPSRISWDKTNGSFVLDDQFKDSPVTWVTSHGAQAYAQWLGAQLPTASQHIYATRANTNTQYPWGDQLSAVVSYAHVRSANWQTAAKKYNSQRDKPLEAAPAPVGAVKDYVVGKALDPAKIVYQDSDSYPVWPCFTKNNLPNAWGLYDMIGNAWEWCIDQDENDAHVICGGSSLSPPQYITGESKLQFKNQACDVSFRIVIQDL